MKKDYKTLLLVPHLNGDGGVVNYYNNLRLESFSNIQYFAVNGPKPQSRIVTILRLMFNYISFTAKVIKGNFKLIHVNPSLYPRSFYRDAVFIIISRLLNRKVLIFFRGWLDDYENNIKKSNFKSFLFKISYAKATGIIVLGAVFKKKLLYMGVPPQTDFFIETTVADSQFVNELNLKEKFRTYNSKVVFLFLAKVAKTKGIYIALAAYKQFSEKHQERKSCFIVAGDGAELLEVKKYVKDQQICNVEFTGQVASSEKKALLLKSHIMLLPSYTEGLPNTILEGMLYGMPIISRVTGAIPDVIKQGVNGFLSDSLEFSVYTGFIESLALDDDLYQKISKENQEIAFRNYSTEKVRERILSIYRSF